MITPEREAELVEKIARRVVELIGAPVSTTSLLTRTEARAYVKRSSERAFGRWVKRWGVKAASHGRYSKDVLDLALAREAGTVRTPASLRRKQEERRAA